MKTIVISQPMYFPWVGFFEQMKLAHAFVFFDNIQFSKGFVNRVQYKTPSGSSWLTVPLKKHSRDTLICDLKTSEDFNWRKKHIQSLELSLGKTKYLKDAIDIVENVLYNTTSFSEMLVDGIMQISDYFDINNDFDQVYRSSEFELDGKKNDLIKNIISHLNGSIYITGMGALNYLDHEDLEANGISTKYMDYKKVPYPQKFGNFNPFVTILDLIANCGKDGRKFICSGTKSWKNLRIKNE